MAQNMPYDTVQKRKKSCEAGWKGGCGRTALQLAPPAAEQVAAAAMAGAVAVVWALRAAAGAAGANFGPLGSALTWVAALGALVPICHHPAHRFIAALHFLRSAGVLPDFATYG